MTSARLTSDPCPLHECESLRVKVTVCFEQVVGVVVFLLQLAVGLFIPQ